MKRYETMSKEDILKFISDASERGNCSGCVIAPTCNRIGCTYNAVKYLQQDKNMKPRIATIDSIEGLEKAFEEYRSFCDEMYCTNCKYKHDGEYNTSDCFKRFLAEEIEVEE